VFPSTVVPRDFDVVEVPFPERGEPRLVKNGARPVSSAGNGADGAGGGGG
jgi:ribonuclease Z